MANKLKPFNLQAALNGEPVMLRDGSKAFVRHHETELPVNDHWSLWGVTTLGSVYTLTWWTKEGRFAGESKDDNQDIIGMWTKTHMVNGFEVPTPETQAPKDGTAYYIPILHTVHFYGKDVWYRDEKWHKRHLKRGMVFLNKEDAIANAEAMVGINPYDEGEE